MKVNQIIGIILLVVGAVSLFYGFQATESVWEHVHESFTGRYTDTTMWYLFGGAISIVAGAIMLSLDQFSKPESD